MRLALDFNEKALNSLKAIKFQMGGEIPVEQGAPQGAPEGGGDPIQMLLEAASIALQSSDCQAALEVCNIVVQSLSGPAEAPVGEPIVQKRGGKIHKICRK